MAEDLGREIGWDDEITSDGNEFTIIPEGTYPFTVLGYERKRYPGGAKMCACNYAAVRVRIDGPDGALGTITTNLYLNEQCFGILSSFFRSIGQKKHGEPLKPQWGKITGAQGRCKVKIRKFTKNDGSDGESNDVQFLDPPEGNPADFNPGAGW